MTKLKLKQRFEKINGVCKNNDMLIDSLLEYLEENKEVTTHAIVGDNICISPVYVSELITKIKVEEKTE